MEERRRHKRYNTAVDMNYTKAEGCATISSLSSTTNISLGGLCVKLSRLIKKGDELLTELTSSYYNKKIVALAKVIWVKAQTEDTQTIYGLEFLWLSSDSMLNEYIGYAR